MEIQTQALAIGPHGYDPQDEVWEGGLNGVTLRGEGVFTRQALMTTSLGRNLKVLVSKFYTFGALATFFTS